MNDTEEQVPTPTKLAELHPRDLSFFKNMFLWNGSLKGCYIRRFYERKDFDGLTIQKWQPLMTKGNYQPLYADLVNSLAEKHLDFERFQLTHQGNERLISPNWETALWVGTMAGSRTCTHAIDIDLHDQIGWYRVPTRWHSSRSGTCDGPHSYRDIPVPRPNLRFYQLAKLVHEAFPNRIWCFSSGSLGFAVGQILREPELTHVVRRKAAAKLVAIGLPCVENYPFPPSPGAKLGRCHRRPCGMDSALWADEGVITSQQTRLKALRTPKYAQALARQYERAHKRDIEHFCEAIRLRFPECPDEEARVIAEHACEVGSGRVGRSKTADDPVRAAVVAHIRHQHTDYDRLLDQARGSGLS